MWADLLAGVTVKGIITKRKNEVSNWFDLNSYMSEILMLTLLFRQLVTASPGTPLFEIFVVKDANKTYSMQVMHKSFFSSSPKNKIMNLQVILTGEGRCRFS